MKLILSTHGNTLKLIMIRCGSEQLTLILFPLTKNICKLGSEKIVNNWHRNGDEAYSGKNSALLQNENNFAFDYAIPSPQTGQFYQVTVWKKGDSENTLIVAGSIDSGEFWAGPMK